MSTTAAAKAAVLELAAAALTAAGETAVQVTWGVPEAWTEPGVVMVGDVTTQRARPRMGPPRTVDETHEVTLLIGASTRLGTPAGQEACTRRVLSLLDVIDAALRAHPTEAMTAAATAAGITLGQLGTQVDLTETDPDDPQLSKGRRSTLATTVTVTARRV